MNILHNAIDCDAYPLDLYLIIHMYRRRSKRELLIRRIFTYIIMVVSIIGIAAVVLLFVLGYRLDSENGLEQGALLQFNTQPTGANVQVDGKLLGSTTPNKSTVLAGSHTIIMSKAGYDNWQKTVNTPAGTLTWLDYAILVPQKLSVQTISQYASLAADLPSPDQKTIILQPQADQATFDLVDISGTNPKTTTITLPSSDYSQAGVAGITHSFTLDRWDPNGRYVLIKHTYGDKTEWIVLDTQNPTNSKNISAILAIDLTSLRFSGTSGNTLFALSDGTIRKIDINADTISGPLVTNVDSFDLYETNIITYVGHDSNNKPLVGLYQDGDTESDVLQTADSSDGLHITTTRYYTDNYVAISVGNDVTILKGSYPHSSADSTSLKPYAQFSFSEPVSSMSFSPEGEYLTVQTGLAFETYDLEHTQSYTGAVDASTAGQPLQWLSQAYLYGDDDGKLTIREFDNTNIHMINTAAIGYDATLSPTGRYLYSIGKDAKNQFTLQRVKMILN